MYNQEDLNSAFSKNVRYLNDCQRIVSVAEANGLQLTLNQAEDIWEHYSDMYCAGWLHIEDDTEILRAIDYFLHDET